MEKWGKGYDNVLMYTCMEFSNKIVIKMSFYMTTFPVELKTLSITFFPKNRSTELYYLSLLPEKQLKCLLATALM